VDLALENAAKTAPPVPQANLGVDVLALLSTKMSVICFTVLSIWWSYQY
jgi:hypothetical protein